MDRTLSSKEKYTQIIKKVFKILVVVTLLLSGFWVIKNQFKPKMDEKEIYTAKVENGEMTQTLTASGTVIPSFEYTINAPVVTEVNKIYLTNGALVSPGDKILELDQEYTALEYEKLKDELSVKKNNIEKLKLQFDKELKDLELQNQIKGLKIDETDAQIKAQIKLKNVGGAAEEDIEKVKLQLRIMNLEKKMLENDFAYKKSSNIVDKQNLELEYGIQVKRLTELKKRLNETTVKAEHKGVITWINGDIGKTVQIGEPLVKIADLNQYKVEAVTSDQNMPLLLTGTPVYVRINRQDLKGKIIQTLPTIENNTIKFFVALDDPAHNDLRPNLQTDVYIILSQKSNTLKLKMGPAITAGPNQELFVIKDGLAIKRKVKKGLTNADYVEIIEGLELGEEVILTETKDLNHLSQFEVKKP